MTQAPGGLLALMDDRGPERVLCVSDTRTGTRGVLVLDNTARGMSKGGTRMSPTVDVPELLAPRAECGDAYVRHHGASLCRDRREPDP